MIQFYFRHGAVLSEADNSRVIIGARKESGFLSRTEPCSRCGGRGGSDAWKFTGWTCYRCNGGCTELRTYRVFTEDKLAKLNAAVAASDERKRKASAKKAEAQRQEFIRWAKPHGKLVGGILMAKGNTFLTDLARKLRLHSTLSERQLEAAVKSVKQAAERAAMDSASEYMGELKKRIEFEAVVIGVYDSEGYYGHTDIVKFRDLSGNMFTWFATGYTGLERNDRMKIKGTVKAHDIYRGVKQTILTRCKFEKFTVMTADEAANAEAVA